MPSPESTVKKNEMDALEERLAMKEMPLKYDSNAMFDVDNLPPPPEYPKWAEPPPRPNIRSKISAEKLSLSKSQPDLSSVGLKDVSNLKSFRRGVSVPRPKTKGRAEYECANEEMWPSNEIVEILIKENSALKVEVEQCYQKVAKAQKVNVLFYIVDL